MRIVTQVIQPRAMPPNKTIKDRFMVFASFFMDSFAVPGKVVKLIEFSVRLFLVDIFVSFSFCSSPVSS